MSTDEVPRDISTTFLIDSFVTGQQLLASMGARVIKADKRGRDFFGGPDVGPKSGYFIELCQRIYATSTPEIYGYSKIREGVCGAAVVFARKLDSNTSASTQAAMQSPRSTRASTQATMQSPYNTRARAQAMMQSPYKDVPASPQVSTSKKAAPPKDPSKTPPSKGPSNTPGGKAPTKSKSANSITSRRKHHDFYESTGQVAGFMHWADCQTLYSGGALLCFADAVDELIEDGWEVVPVPEKPKASGSSLDDDADPFVSRKK